MSSSLTTTTKEKEEEEKKEFIDALFSSARYGDVEDIKTILNHHIVSNGRKVDDEEKNTTTSMNNNFVNFQDCAMRFMRYPNNDDNNNNNDKKKNKSKSSDDAKEVGVSEHTDFEMMTFLHQNERGLYVKKRRGKNRDEEKLPG